MGTTAEESEVRAWLRGLQEGRVGGMTKVLLKVLAARGIHVDDSGLRAIEHCKDPEMLDRWLNRALVATRLEEVLDGPAQQPE